MTNPQMQSEQAFAEGHAVETVVTEGETLAIRALLTTRLHPCSGYASGTNTAVMIAWKSYATWSLLKQQVAEGQIDL